MQAADASQVRRVSPHASCHFFLESCHLGLKMENGNNEALYLARGFSTSSDNVIHRPWMSIRISSCRLPKAKCSLRFKSGIFDSRRPASGELRAP